MTDAELIYNACLRTEKRLEDEIRQAGEHSPAGRVLSANLFATQILREEIGHGLATTRPR